MRRLSMFAAGFALMMVAGIAAAQLGGGTNNAPEDPTYGVSAEAEPTIEAPIVEQVDDTEAVDTTVQKEPSEREQPKVAAGDDGVEPKPEPSDPETENDTTPPEFAILHPENGQEFDQKEVVFEGEVEPGSKVFAGDYEAEVRDDGTWRIVLWLQPGQNVATLKAVDEAGNVSTASVTVFRSQESSDGDDRSDEPKNEKPAEEPPKNDEPGEEEPKEEEAVVDFKIHQKLGASDATEPFEVFWGTGRPDLVIELMSPYGDRRIEVGASGEWATELFFHEVPAYQRFEIVVETSDGHREVFTFKWEPPETD